MIPSRPGRTRTLVLAAALLVVLGLGGYLAYRSPVVQRWFARDTENAEELDRLRATPPTVPPPAGSSAGWPQWRGPLRDGRAPAGPFRTDWDKSPPKELWRQPVGGGYGSLAVVGGRVYVQDRQGGNERVVCLDAAKNGELLWSHEYPASPPGSDRTYANGPRATPTVDGNRVYAVGGAGKFLCLEAPAAGGNTPRVVWEHDLTGEFGARVPQWGVACSPLVDGDQVIVQPGGRDGSVVAFDKATGAVRWKVGSNPPGYSSPVAATVHGVRVILAFTGDALLCVRSDGELMGSYPWATRHHGNIATPLVLDDYVFISSAYEMGCALLRVKSDGDRVKLEAVYSRRGKPIRAHHSTPVVRGKYLFGFDGDNLAHLTCLDYTDGSVVPEWEGTRVPKGTLILAGDHLVILTERGELVLAEANPEEYRQLARVPSGLSGSNNWALPVLVDGRLYLRDDTKVLCLDVRPSK